MTTRIPPSEHVFVGGQTGTGKSFLAELYLAGFDYVVKLDTKGEYWERKSKGQDPWMGLKENRDFVMITRLADLSEVGMDYKKIIYVPEHDEMELEFYDAVMKWVYDRKNTTLWIDELMSVAENPQKYPPYLKAIMTRGRSRNVSCWALTQRPMDIPPIILSQTSHFFIYDFQLPQDRKKIADATGAPEFLEKPSTEGGKYAFWYFKNGWVKPTLSKLTIKQTKRERG